MQSFKIFKASAGSGKTFTLTVEYIKLLIANQEEYKYTLAVTFTKKATAEMKQRILSTLYGMQHHLESSENYFLRIKESPEISKLNLDDEEIRRRAGVALHNMLHDYARFRIVTIDSFFISIVRDIAREMDLTGNLNIHVDHEEVLSEAVDDIIDKLQENSPEAKIILRFIDEKIDGGEPWHIGDEIKEFGKNIFNEKFIEKGDLVAKDLDNDSKINAYSKKLQAMRTECRKQLAELAKEFVIICRQNGWEATDFSQKERGVYGFFLNLSAEDKDVPKINSYTAKCIDNGGAWFAKGKGDSTIAEEQLVPLLSNVVKLHVQYQRIDNSVTAICKHLNHMIMLGEIDRKVKLLNTDANRFLLASTSHLLSKMIDGNSVPFIYEKSGTQFRHIMIDEFQDTSALQWRNFMPLLLNSLDNGEMCLIVGDVKQSIYRWRNSDWQILNGINEDKEFEPRILPQPPLNTNRRSLGNIISFNNAFFTTATRALNEEYKSTHNGKDSVSLLKAYSDVCQEMDEKNRGLGYVSVECLRSENEDFDYVQRSYDRVVELVEGLVADGVAQNEICILTRNNRHIPAITKTFADSGSDVKIVSNEAYQLRSSSAISILMAALRFLAYPKDKTNLYTLAVMYLTKVRNIELADAEVQQYMMQPVEELAKVLPEEFTSAAGQLIYEPLLELVEKIFAMFQLDSIPDQDAYLFYFHDCLVSFAENNSAEVDAFLRHWDEKMGNQTIPGETADGVKIMSIHKSKGLEFQTVIIPFCDWDMGGKSTELLWCTPEETPYNEMGLVAVNLRKTLMESIFDKDYDNEVLRYSVDNLNLLYVAFTRPKANLIILTSEDDRKKDAPISNIKHLVTASLPEGMEYQEIPDVGDVWSMGKIVPSKVKEESEETDNEDESEKNLFEISAKPENVTFASQLQLPEFKQSNESKDFIRQHSKEEDEEENETELEEAKESDNTKELSTEERSYVDRGLLYHNIYQHIRVADDADNVIEKMMMEGIFRSMEEKEQVSRDIRLSLSDKVTGRWFTDKWRIVNERTLMFRDEETGEIKECRPDRVIMSDDETIVIDYKTGRFRKKHKEQVEAYMNHLIRMGYPNVKGYVWYILSGKSYRV